MRRIPRATAAQLIRTAGKPAKRAARRACVCSLLTAALLLLLPREATTSELGCPGSSNPDPAVLFCDSFDDGIPPENRWNGYSAGGGGFVPQAGAGVAGSTAMRVRYQSGQVSAGRFSIGIGKLPPFYQGGGENWQHVVSPGSVHRDLYWREYIRFGDGWTGVAYKQSRARVLVEPEASDPGPHRTAFQAHFWPDTNSGNAQPDGVLFFNNTRGVDESGAIIDRGNNTNTSIWLPRTHGTTILYKNYPEGSDWLCVEAHVRLNDPGASNGVEEFWIDGSLEARRADQNHIGTHTEYGLNQVIFDNYWNGGSPQQNALYRDNIVISTERIGCLDDSAPPPPSGVPPAAPLLLP